MIEREWARGFAQDWIASWNALDNEWIMAHYSDEVEIVSPLIIQRLGKPDGRLQGQKAVREYWLTSIAMDPPLKFELLDVLVGVDSVTIHYANLGRRVVAETLFFDASHQVTRGVVHRSVLKPSSKTA